MEVSKKGGKGAWWGRFLVVQTIPWNTGNKNQSYPGLKTRLTQSKNTYHAFSWFLESITSTGEVLQRARGVGGSLSLSNTAGGRHRRHTKQCEIFVCVCVV